jgi:hypothetical protein
MNRGKRKPPDATNDSAGLNEGRNNGRTPNPDHPHLYFRTGPTTLRTSIQINSTKGFWKNVLIYFMKRGEKSQRISSLMFLNETLLEVELFQGETAQ